MKAHMSLVTIPAAFALSIAVLGAGQFASSAASGAALVEVKETSPRVDGRDALLAALGKATLDCLGTVEPSTYRTNSGMLARTFSACTSRDRTALKRVDALLGVQRSKQGRADDLAGFYTKRWNSFVQAFPTDQAGKCPVWTFDNVVNAPTTESVPRAMAAHRPGEENARYSVFSSQCAQDRECSVNAAVACTAGFGPGFIVDRDPRRSRVEVDPVWWQTHYVFADDASNPFMMDGYYHGMSYYGTLPGSLYGAIERAGEACSQWDEISQMHYIDRVLVPIDCGGGWYCMTYCTLPPWTNPR